eukprot:2768404-Pyramimonas_sp.AAC.1
MASLSEWFGASTVAPEYLELVGGAEVPSKRFFLRVRGDAGVGGARALALARALRLPGGSWRSFQ